MGEVLGEIIYHPETVSEKIKLGFFPKNGYTEYVLEFNTKKHLRIATKLNNSERNSP